MDTGKDTRTELQKLREELKGEIEHEGKAELNSDIDDLRGRKIIGSAS
jgi:hypothetical protein